MGAPGASAGGLGRGAAAGRRGWLVLSRGGTAGRPPLTPRPPDRPAGGLAETPGAPQAPGAPAPSVRDANFRASGGVDAGTEAATRVRLRPGPGGLLKKGGRTPGGGVRLGVGACPSRVPARPWGGRLCARRSAGP